MSQIVDAGIVSSLTAGLGHAPPFADDELASLAGPLIVTNARDLSAIARLRSLTDLTLHACEPTSLPSLAPLTSLRRLRILGCTVESLEFLRGCAALEELEVNFTLVRDPSPIFELAALRSAVLVGNPFDPDGMKLGQARHAERPPVLELPNSDERRIQRALVSRGFGVGFASVDVHGAPDTAIVVRPGISQGIMAAKEQTYRSTDDVDFAETWVSAMDNYIAAAPAGATTEAFFASLYMDRPAADRGASRLSMHATLGDAADAARWIDGVPALPERDATALRRFIGRFPTVRFFREDAALGTRIATQAGVKFPDWFLAVRSRVLTFVEPRRRVLVRFDGYDKPHSPRAEYAQTIWYELTLQPIADPYVAKMYESCGAFPIAHWPSEMRSTLVIGLGGDDARILECAEADLFDARADKRDPAGSMYVAFESYASMLGHVVELMVDGESIKAR